MNRVKGILLTVFAATSFGFIPLFAKIAFANGLNPYTFTLFRSLFATIELFTLLKIRKIDYTLEKEQYITLFKASFIGYSLTMLTLTLSYNYMSTGLATTIHFVYPVAVMVGSTFFFNEKINKRKIFSLVLSLTGIYFLASFDSLGSTSIIGVLLSLFSGFFYAYYILTVAHGNIKEINPFVLIFYVSLFNSYILFAISIFLRKLETNYTFKGIVSTVLVALIANLVGMVSFKAGIKSIGPSTAAILSTFEPITSLILGMLVFREVLSWYHIVGCILIITSATIVAFREKDLKIL
jgi:drug/metabolite transporter (DMT)-like permease